MPPHGPIQIVVNPVSGRSGNRAIVEALRLQAEADGMPVTVCPTQGPGHAETLANGACEDGISALVVVGGDGTIREVVNGMTEKGPPILIVPSGTENILAKYLGLRAELPSIRQVLLQRRVVELDVVLSGGRRFLLIAGVGFDAEVVRRLTLERSGHITYLSYFWPIWRSFWSYRQPQLFVEADGKQVFAGQGLVFVGSIPRYAVGLRLLLRAAPSDGLLDVCVFQCCQPFTLLRHATNVMLRRHVGSRGVLYLQARRVRVWSNESVPVEIDGDLAGALPQEFEVADTKARFLVARDWQG
jgi:diacylglycerol kinase (ATP)